MAGINALVRALNTDVEWLREHTRYLTLARSWDEAGRRDNRLLSGTDINAAKEWVGRRPKGAPELTELHLDFIRASEEAEAARASAERKQLAEIEEAQASHAEALARAEQATADKLDASRRVVRRTVAGFIAALLLATLAGGLWLSLETNNDRRRQMPARPNASQCLPVKKPSARISSSILCLQTPRASRVMGKTSLEAITVTSTLATTSDEGERKRSRERFWELYYGPMYIVEIHQAKKSGIGHSKIEEAMVMIGRRLQVADGSGEPLPHSSLCPLANAVRDECIAYLNVTAPRACP